MKKAHRKMRFFNDIAYGDDILMRLQLDSHVTL